MVYEWDLIELKFVKMEDTSYAHLTQAQWVFIDGKQPKKGDIVKLVNGQTVKIFRMPNDWPMDRNDIGAAQIDWHEIIGGTITVLTLLQKLLLAIQGMMPAKK